MFFIVFNNDHRSRRRGIVYHNYRGGRRRCNHSLYRYRRRYRTLGIRRPSRRHRAHSSTAPDPSTVIPVPILITGYPNAIPPTVTIFRNHHYGLSNCRGWNYIDFLLRRKEYIIQIAEKSVESAGIGAMVDYPSRNMGADTGAPGKDAPDQGCT